MKITETQGGKEKYPLRHLYQNKIELKILKEHEI